MSQGQRPVYALALRLGGAAALSTLLALVKLAATTGMAVPEVMFWRQAIPATLLIGWLAINRSLPRLRTRRLASHAGRAGSGMFGMLCSFGSAALLPLAESTTLGFTTPLFAVLIAALVLREPVGWWRWGAVLLGFLGVLVVTRPGVGPISTLGVAAGLCSGLMVAIISFQIKDLAATEEPVTVVFYFALFGAAFMAPALPWTMGRHDPWQWLLICAIGVTGLVGQLLLTAALRHGAVASVVIMDYSALMWATLYGSLLFDWLPPATTWLGAPLIVAAGATVAWRETRLARAPTPPTTIAVD